MATETTLIIGPPGSGKSNFLATYPKPMLVLDFDCKGTQTILQARQAGIEFWTFPEPFFLSAMEIKTLPKKGFPAVRSVEKNEAVAWKQFTEAISELWAGKKAYTTIAIDTWTFLGLAAARRLQWLNGQIGMPLTQPDYGVLLEKFKETIPILLGLPCEHLVMAAHEEVKEDETTHEVRMVPWSVGAKIAFILPAFFQNYYQTYTRRMGTGETYMVRTGMQGLFDGRCIHNAPNELPQDWGKFPKERK